MSDINDRIAKAKGWKVERKDALDLHGQPLVWKGQECYREDWYDPDGQYQGDRPPDFTGTLKGLAGMLRELGGHWVWGWGADELVCSRGENCGSDEYFCSPPDRPGDCVGDAYMSVFGKET